MTRARRSQAWLGKSGSVAMREVIQKVIETEGEAKGVVAGAQAAAERLLAQARQTAKDFEAQARQELRAEAGGCWKRQRRRPSGKKRNCWIGQALK